MATRKTLGRGGSGSAQQIGSGRACLRILLALPIAAAAAAALIACSSAGTSPPSSGNRGPAEDKGNGLNAAGGLWHEVTASSRAPAGNSSSSGGDYGRR